VSSCNQFWPRARSGAKPYRIVKAIKKISSGASRLIRYPAQRHPPPQAAPGEVPHTSLTAHQGGNQKGWHSRPEDVLQYPVRRRCARKKSRLGQPVGDKDEGCGRRVHQHQDVAIGCLPIHDRSGEASAAPTPAAGSATIGTRFDSTVTAVRPSRPRPASRALAIAWSPSTICSFVKMLEA
jgi:hypothetical protein